MQFRLTKIPEYIQTNTNKRIIHACDWTNALYQAIKFLGYKLDAIDPEIDKLNQKLIHFNSNWKFSINNYPSEIEDYKNEDEEGKAYMEYNAYILDLTKEFGITQSAAANIVFAYGKNWYQPEMLVELVKFDSANPPDYQPNLAEMKWKWENGKFVRKLLCKKSTQD